MAILENDARRYLFIIQGPTLKNYFAKVVIKQKDRKPHFVVLIF